MERKNNMEKGILYVMTTVVDGLVKVGKTASYNFERRMYNLEHNGYCNITGLKREFAIEVNGYSEKEDLFKKLFQRSRVANTELYSLDLNQVIQLLSSFEGKKIYPENESKEEVFQQVTAAVESSELPEGDYFLSSKVKGPNGKEKVEGTPMDFRTPHEVGERIDEDFEALNFGKGYDHTYILNKKEENELSLCARCTSPKTGIVMECYTTQPGVQLYTGNWMTGNFVGKNGQRYPARAALCLETQHYPDSPNKPEYPSTVLRPGETFQSKTIYKFSVE